MENYRPAITRSNIFNQLHKIVFRYNENPILVFNRTIIAFKYAEDTINLLNKDNRENKINKIRKEDKIELLIRIFCIKNCTKEHNNNGQINKLTNTRITKEKPKTIQAYGLCIKGVLKDIQSTYYNGRDDFIIKSYEPIPLPMWEHAPSKFNKLLKSKPNTLPYNNKRNKNNKRNRKYNNNHYNNNHYNNNKYDNPLQPPPNKKQKLSSSKRCAWCWKCGRNGHQPNECFATIDIDGESIPKRSNNPWKYTPSKTGGKPPISQSNNKNYNTSKYNSNNKQFKHYNPNVSQINNQSTSSNLLSLNQQNNPSSIHQQLLSLSNIINNDQHSPLNDELISQTNNLLKTISSSYIQQSSNKPKPRQ